MTVISETSRDPGEARPFPAGKPSRPREGPRTVCFVELEHEMTTGTGTGTAKWDRIKSTGIKRSLKKHLA